MKYTKFLRDLKRNFVNLQKFINKKFYKLNYFYLKKNYIMILENNHELQNFDFNYPSLFLFFKY